MHKPVPMRRKDRAISEGEALAILEQGEWGILATADGDGVPLATPLSYVLLDGAVYFHCAKTGHKLANIDAQPAVCFSVVGPTRPALVKGDFTTYYESTLVHGAAARVQNEAERRRVLMALCEKYMPGHGAEATEAIGRSGGATEVIRISIEQVSGKARR